MDVKIVRCDIPSCARDAVERIRMSINGHSYDTDRCEKHLADELALARPAPKGPVPQVNGKVEELRNGGKHRVSA